MSRPKTESDVVELHVRVCQNGFLVTEIYDNPEYYEEGVAFTSIPKKIVRRHIASDTGEVGHLVICVSEDLLYREQQASENGKD